MSAIDTNMLDRLGLSRPPEPAKDVNQLSQETFLELMITQLTNQDPFEPMESGAFLGQMAQFATVSGIGELKESFMLMARSMNSNQALQAAGLVDREVMVPVELATLSEENTIRGSVDVLHASSDVEVGVYTLSGELLRTISLGSQASGMANFSWDGMTDAGTRAPNGVYEFRAIDKSPQGGGALEVFMAARVQSVSLGNANQGGGLTLMVEGLGEIDFSKVRQIA